LAAAAADGDGLADDSFANLLALRPLAFGLSALLGVSIWLNAPATKQQHSTGDALSELEMFLDQEDRTSFRTQLCRWLKARPAFPALPVGELDGRDRSKPVPPAEGGQRTA